MRLLQIVKASPEYRRHFGYADARSFRSYLDSMPDLAGRIEALAPGVAGLTRPNAEDPWADVERGDAIAPADFAFTSFDPRSPRMAKLDKLLDALLRIE